MTTPVAATTDAELTEVVLRAIGRAEAPLAANKLKNLLPKSLKVGVPKLSAALEELAARGRLYRYVKGKTVAFGLEKPETLARVAVLGAVTDTPQTWPVLKKQPNLKAAAACLGAKPLDAARDALCRERSIFEWPKVAKKHPSARYAARAIDPRDFLGQSGFVDNAVKAIRGALKKDQNALSKLGLNDTQIESAAFVLLIEKLGGGPNGESPPPPELVPLFLDRMIDEDPAAASGAPVSLRNLRRALAFQFPDKASFDHAVLALAREGAMALHRYDHPAGLTEVERDDLVPDGHGGLYVAISRRS
jgi:hypothetical protein